MTKVLRFGFFGILAALALVALGVASAAQARTALVIGNSAYPTSPLANPKNDAADVAAALRAAGFDVIVQLDASQAKMQEAVAAFAGRVKAKGGVALFYFAGHGMQVEGENYLMPVDAGMGSTRDLARTSVKAGEIVESMAKSRDGLNIVILDACRNNPIADSSSRGLSRIDTNARLFLSYSTSPGAVALDGTGRNSPYTKHLVESISAAGLSIEETFKRTLKGVYQETRGAQTPWLSSSFFGDFVFRPKAGEQAAASDSNLRIVDTGAVQRIAALGGIYRETGTNPSGSKYRGMAAIMPQGDKANIIWWIAKDTFPGTGELAGRMLVVNWNRKHPVLYKFGDDGVLDGEWADGSATDRLELFAPLDPRPAPPPQGQYTTDGMNANGSPYSGTVAINRRGDKFEFAWKTGATSFSGTGTRNGNLMIVDWGSTMPMIYALNPDGTLKGLFDSGRGHETLTPIR